MRNDPNLDADGRLGKELLHPLVDRRTHRHHVSALHRGDAKSYARLSVVAHDARRRFLVVARDRHEVAEMDSRDRAVALGHGDHKALEVLDGLYRSAREEPHILVVHAHPAGVRNGVLPLDDMLHHLRRDAEVGHLRTRHLKRHDFLPVAQKVDLRDIVAEKEIAPQKLRVLLELRLGEAVAVDRVENSVDVAVVIEDSRLRASRRQRRRLVADLPA